MAALTNNIAPYTSYTLYVLRLIPAAGIFHALYPLWKRRNDDLSDIPLTPSQRSLLGLEPSTKPDSPAIGNYVTPPRYARSVTPSSNRSNSGSPFSGRDSVGSGIGNTYSPTASPLLHKAIGREARRQSLGASTSLQYPRALNEPSTALAIGSGSPGGIRSNASVGLNNRWLYEKGRNSPKSTTRGVYT
jgi:nucleoporin POM34